MRKIFIILYSGSNSNAVETAVKSYDSWFHFGKDSFLISTPNNTKAEQIRLKLEPNIVVGKDKILVMEVNIKDANGYLHDNEWDWIKSERSRV